MLVALVVGLNMPSIKQSTNTPNITDGEAYNYKVGIKPSTTPINFEYEADKRLQTAENSKTEKVYKFGFGNTMDQNKAVKLISNLQQNNVTVKYAYGNVNLEEPTLAQLQVTDGITVTDTRDLHHLGSKGTETSKIYVYVIVSVIDPSISTSFATSLSWGYGTSTTVTYIVGDNTYTSDEIENLQMPEPEEPEVSEGMVFVGWYLDTNFTTPATFPMMAGNIKLYGKEKEYYPEGNLGNSWFKLNDDGASYSIKRGEESDLPADLKVIIPETYEGLPITGIIDGVNKTSGVFNNSSIKEIMIPRTVKSIGNYAFYSCRSLQKVTLPKSTELTSVGNDAFYYCTLLTTPVMPSTLTNIGEGAFDGCWSFTEINIPEGVTAIKQRTFGGCNKVTSINIPDNIISIGDNAFGGCTALTSVTIPSSVTSIGTSVFGFCRQLVELEVELDNPVYDSRNNCNAIIETSTNTLIQGCNTTIIPTSVTGIGNSAFNGSGLTGITIPASVTNIETYAFVNTGNCANITFEANSKLTTIGIQAFGNSGITTITIPKSVTSMGDQAFYTCNQLEEIIVEDGNTVYDSRDNCNAIIETATNTLTHGCQTSVIPNTVTTIGGGSFHGCGTLTSIEIPHSVTTIGNAAFTGSGLESITIPNSVTSMSNYVFQLCGNLTTVTFEEGCKLTNIPAHTFSYGGLEYIIIPSSITTIGEYAFAECKFTGIVVPASVKKIEKCVFQDCNELIGEFSDAITFEDTTTWYRSDLNNYTAFNDSDKVDVTDPMQNAVRMVATAGYYDYYWYKSDEDSYPEGNLGSSWFDLNEDETGYTVITGETTSDQFPTDGNVVIPETWEGKPVTAISYHAFQDCTQLTSVTIPASVTEILASAFSNCDNLANLKFKDNSNLTYIGSSAFSNCSSLAGTIDIPGGLTIIEGYTFSGCSKLTEIVLPSTVEQIAMYAFQSCSSLKGVTIPQNVIKIWQGAFAGCTGLTASGSEGIIFENTTISWFRTTDGGFSGGAEVYMTSPTQNATWLVSTYSNYYWYQSGAGNQGGFID